jgi:phytoene synthase
MSVQQAYAECRARARSAGSSFYTGMRLLPPRRREAMFALYALARRIDDIGDEPGDDGTKLRRLQVLRASLDDLDSADDPVLVAVADVLRRYPVPLEAFHDLVDGVESDVRGKTYRTFEELEVYCGQVAGSIGRLAVGVFDARERPRASKLANDLGVALQIGNILRDVREDLALGRHYLPEEDLARFGCAYTKDGIDGPVELVLAFEAQRGLAFLERGLELVPLLDRRSAACVLAMAGGYRKLLTRIALDPSLPLAERISLNRWDKTVVLAKSLVKGVA